MELIWEFPSDEKVGIEDEPFPNEHILLISTIDPWYKYILVYIQTLKCPATFSQEYRCKLRLNAKYYLIISDTLYRRGEDSILRQCLTHEEVEIVLNDSHSGACGGHLSGLAMAQNILHALGPGKSTQEISTNEETCKNQSTAQAQTRKRRHTAGIEEICAYKEICVDKA